MVTSTGFPMGNLKKAFHICDYSYEFSTLSQQSKISSSLATYEFSRLYMQQQQ
jgi:hypothetical protein